MSKVFILNRTQPNPFAPVQLNARFFAMTPMPTVAAHDVMKNAAVERDSTRFDSHLSTHF
ncbi:MAG: hypothetical protein AAFV31_08390 [Pseudomonadota bacterium]